LTYDEDASIEEALSKALEKINLGPFAIDAEAFRLGLPDQAALTQLISSEEARHAQIVESYLRRRSKRPPPVVDAEFEPA
jgi:hypothetical protein